MASIELAGPPPGAGDVDALRPGGSPLDPGRKEARNGIPDALLVVSIGVFLVALAYARSRTSSSFGTPLFWTGQVLIFAFVVYRVLKASTSAREREVLVLLYAGAQSAIRWAYSPVMFQWCDELQHLGSLLNALRTHHLFHTNHDLPISPWYPGMENVTAELVQVSSASTFVAGVVIASASHVLLAAAVLLLFREVSRSSRVACIGVILYLLSPQIHYFDTSFIYENVALPFLALSIFFAIRFAAHERRRHQSLAGMLACVAIAVMTHHATALATVAILAGIALATSLFASTRDLARRLAVSAGAGALVVGCWMFFVAPATADYLGDAGPQILNGLAQLGKADGKSKLPTSLAIPLVDRLCNPGGVALMLVLLAVSVRLARPLPPLQRLFICLAPGLYALMIVIRLFVGSPPNGEHPDGAELAIRSLTYFSIFTALAVAVVLDRLVTTAATRRGRSVPMPSGQVTATAIAIVLLLHSITTGLPQWWQRLPGPFLVDGYVSGIDSVGTARGEWAAKNLPAGARYFGDVTSLVLVSSLSELDPIAGPGSLYDTTRLTPEDSALIGGLLATYLDVDTRMAQQAPVTRYLFKSDVMAGTRESPLYAGNLAKFDNLAGISRIYDSGYDHFYDLRAMQNIYGH
ncbi:glycosyltransferase family 39 protein [Mycobacterium sp. E787]|uniref:glycosyltransferase family 39 protein n=1 Tax=Mycobacterium sp. E787 TaxID=1834150 RepID=UPI0012EA4239|nr:glycosyltransferase family 39 protein [Mycobacterium sp. E787]